MKQRLSERARPRSGHAVILAVDEYFLCPPANVSSAGQICFCDRLGRRKQFANAFDQIIADICDSVPAEPFLQDAALRRDWLDAQFLN